MKLKFLGAHSCESISSRCATLLVDDIISIDAGALLSSLSFEEQHKIKYVFLTHQHYDHIKDLPLLGFNNIFKSQLKVYAMPETISVLKENIFTDKLWLDLSKVPPDAPHLKFISTEIQKEILVDGYTLTPFLTPHSFTSCGYYLEKDKKALFYSGDTGPNIENIWKYISPQLLILEVTFPDRMREISIQYKHLCPSLLKEEIDKFRKVKKYLPQIIATHLHPDFDEEITNELNALNLGIIVAKEGREIIL